MRFVLLIACWLLWVLSFVFRKGGGGRAVRVDKRARAGILLQTVGFWLVWGAAPWTGTAVLWRTLLSLVLLPLGVLLAWTAVRALGRQWRLDAGLNADHELVRSGPYRLVRHPIYASMLCMLLGSGFLVTPPLLFAAAVALFLAGTEIRVRVEDGLLAARFGDVFRSYRQTVPAYIPYVR